MKKLFIKFLISFRHLFSKRIRCSDYEMYIINYDKNKKEFFSQIDDTLNKLEKSHNGSSNIIVW